MQAYMKNSTRGGTRLLISLGLLIGFFSFFSFPVFFALCLSFCAVLSFRRYSATPDEKRFITYVCTLAILLRVLVSLFILIYGRLTETGSDIFGDAMSYEGVGVYIKELVSGSSFKGALWGDNLAAVKWLRQAWKGIDASLGNIYTIPSISYWYAFLHMLWGESFLAPKILNGLLWVMGSFWLYLFFRERFTPQGARLGLCIMLFLPSSVVFSSSGLKDSMFFFLIIAVIFASHKLGSLKYGLPIVFSIFFIPLAINLIAPFNINKISFIIFCLFFLSIAMLSLGRSNVLSLGLSICCGSLFLSTLREYIHLFILLFGLVIACIDRINLKKTIPLIVASVLILIIPNRIKIYERLNSEIKKRFSESVLQNYNTAIGNTAYYVYPEKFYSNTKNSENITIPEFLFSYLNGIRYVILEPAPWTFRGFFTSAIFPETLLMYFLLPFIILGAVVAARINPRAAFITFSFLGIITSLLAFGQGNMGTLVRIRYMVTSWYFMIGAIGLGACLPRIFKNKYRRGIH